MLTISNKTRGRALEEAFFFRMDQELIELLSRNLKREEKLQSFADATGIRERKRLEALINAGFEVSTLTAFMWVPLVFVAWADGHADEFEKRSIRNALTRKGVPESTAEMMIEHDWFRRCPTEELWQAWEEFISTTLDGLTASVRNEMIDEIVSLCHVVANASGGVWGIGRVSASESAVIGRVIQSLQRFRASDQAESLAEL